MVLIGRAAWKICFNQSEALPRSDKKGQEIVLLHVTSYRLFNLRRIIDFSLVTSLRLVGRLPSAANGRYQISEQN